MVGLLHHPGKRARRLVSNAVALALRTMAGGLAALPVAAASLAVLAWLRWQAIPLRTVAAEVVSSSGALLVSLLPAAAVGARGRRPVPRRIVRGLLVAMITVAPAISLVTGRRIAEVIEAAKARPVDFSMLLASHAAGCAVAAVVAGAAAPRRRPR